MININEAREIQKRFQEEQEHIKKFISLVQYNIVVQSREVEDIFSIMLQYDIIDEDNSLKILFGLLDKNLLTIIPDIQIKIQNEIDRSTDYMKTIEPKNRDIFDPRSEIGQIIQVFLEDGYDNLSSKNVLNLLLEWNMDEQTKDYLFYFSDTNNMNDFSDFVVCSTNFFRNHKKVNKLKYASIKLDKIMISVQIQNSDSSINILHQGFISLLTIFDATVFDLIRILLKQNFFQFIALLDKKATFSVSEISSYNSLDEMKQAMIEDQVKKKYLKDILFILRDQGVELVSSGSKYKFEHLIEIVKRRNIHIHNRGMVDTRYLDFDKEGKSAYNIYNFKLGDHTYIDSEYWNMTNILCQECIDSIVVWIEQV